MRDASKILLLVAVVVLALPLSLADDAGKALYDKKCAMCHGKDGIAKKMAEGSADLNDPEWQKANAVDSIVGVTTTGKGKMKGFDGKLSEEEIKQIADYVKTLNR
jgi:cytochrome c6